MSHFTRASLSRSHRLLHLPNSGTVLARVAYALVVFSLPFSSFSGFGSKVDAAPVQQETSSATETTPETGTPEPATAETASAQTAAPAPVETETDTPDLSETP